MIEINQEWDEQLTNELIIDTATEIYDQLTQFVQQAKRPDNAYRSKLVLPLIDNETLYPEAVLSTLYGLTYGGNRQTVIVVDPEQASQDESAYWAGWVDGGIFYVKEEYKLDSDGFNTLTTARAFTSKPNSEVDVKPNFEMSERQNRSISSLAHVVGWLLRRTTSK